METDNERLNAIFTGGDLSEEITICPKCRYYMCVECLSKYFEYDPKEK